MVWNCVSSFCDARIQRSGTLLLERMSSRGMFFQAVQSLILVLLLVLLPVSL
jgi:hypothetical protein